MAITSRDYSGDQDFWLIRQLLVESYGLTRRLHNWTAARLEVDRFVSRSIQYNQGISSWHCDIRLWQTEAGKVVGAIYPEGQPDNIFLQIHPEYRFLENEMLEWAERHLTSLSVPVLSGEEGSGVLNIFSFDYDSVRNTLLQKRDYCHKGGAEVIRRRSLELPLPPSIVPAGYCLRPLDSENRQELAQLSITNSLVFNQSCWTPDTIRLTKYAPSYRPELDLVVIAPDGMVAAFTTVWMDEVNRIAELEPVGTHPGYRRKGLAAALIYEGLRRVRAMGTRLCYVGAGYGSEANYLYEAVGFCDFEVLHRWQKDMAALNQIAPPEELTSTIQV